MDKLWYPKLRTPGGPVHLNPHFFFVFTDGGKDKGSKGNNEEAGLFLPKGTVV